MLSCRDVTRIVSSDELENAGALLKFRVKLHFLLCVRCKRYADQIRMIGIAARERAVMLLPEEEHLLRLEKSILDDAFGAQGKQT